MTGRLLAMGAWVLAADAPVVVADPPDWLDYMAAFGTVAAALVPLVFYLLERRSRRDAEARLEAQLEYERDRKERVQAEQMHFWLEGEDPTVTETEVTDPRKLVWINASNLPVREVDVLYTLTTQDPIEGLPSLKVQTFGFRIGVLKPSGGTSGQLLVRDGVRMRVPTGVPTGHVILSYRMSEVRFRDSSNRWWSRDLERHDLHEYPRRATSLAMPSSTFVGMKKR